MKQYGHLGFREAYPLAAWIWGHRLRQGQDWMEYLLEFLNVLVGFDYELGQGLTIEGATPPSEQERYKRFTRLGLRRFVFYDEREKTRHDYDDEAHELLVRELEALAKTDNGSETHETLSAARSLLRAFTAVESQRSWYAKSLFPAHESLLFWEALRKGATKKTGGPVRKVETSQELDAEIAFDARNFFARGGEIYYLILSAGTQNHPERRQHIAQCLQGLLSDHYQPLGKLAKIIDDTWQKHIGNGIDSVNYNADYKEGNLGWIPDSESPLYEILAEDLNTFLRADLDPLESLNLLAYLMGFHLTLYIYHRAHMECQITPQGDPDRLESCSLALLVDVLEGIDGGAIRSVSAISYREQEAQIIAAGRHYVTRQVTFWAKEDFPDNLLLQAEEHFPLIKGVHKTKKDKYQNQANALLDQLQSGEVDQSEFTTAYGNIVAELLLDDLRKEFLGVHRKLAKAIGFVAPRNGTGARFVISDPLLKALTLANLSSGSEMIYDDFLARLYSHYGLVIGPSEAQRSNIFERHRINAEHYDRNRSALLDKMKHAGLVIEYSDATAVVQHKC